MCVWNAERLTAEARRPDGRQMVCIIRNTILPQSESAVLHSRIPANLQVVERTERTRRFQRESAKCQTDNVAWVSTGRRANVQAVDACQVVTIVKRKIVAGYCPTAACIWLATFHSRWTYKKSSAYIIRLYWSARYSASSLLVQVKFLVRSVCPSVYPLVKTVYFGKTVWICHLGCWVG